MAFTDTQMRLLKAKLDPRLRQDPELQRQHLELR